MNKIEPEQANNPIESSPVNRQSAAGKEPLPKLPEDTLIVVPVRNMVLFPGVVIPVTVGRDASIAAAQEAVRGERKIGIIAQRDPGVDDPTGSDLYTVGTVSNVLRYLTTPDGAHHLVCQGEQRFHALDWVEGYPFLVARVENIPESKVFDSKEIEARWQLLQQKAQEAAQLLPQAPAELFNAIQSISSPSALADLVASFIDIAPPEKQKILEMIDVRQRIDRVLEVLNHRIEVLRLSQQIDKRTKESIDERQREYVLREQLKTIQKELGEDQGDSEIDELSQAIREAKMPEDVEKDALKELKRLQQMPEAAAEHAMVKTYLEWLIALPWSGLDEESIDIAKAREILERDHFGLEKVKKRILEYLAVRKLNPEGRSPILCFVGPPGVGKTSLGQSIARALGLKFVRASLGGVHDEAEIRGHRRTYIGSLPGNIIQAIRKTGARNPVFMLDEMDKLSAGFHGNPSAALLEVLDPEQNASFRDNYLGVPFDLSKVFFIGTANVLNTIPGPLLDRMEIIELPGYTGEEKFEIARRYLVGRQLALNGLSADQVKLGDGAIRGIVEDYTREAGVRGLERQIGAVFRNAAMQISEGTANTVYVEAGDLHAILGPKKFESEIAMRTSVPGVATGLAWTPAGGDILFIETSCVQGSGKLILTGQLGEVMKESAQAALSLVKIRASTLQLDPNRFEHSDIHIHVPAGAIPKDGPSAGVAIFISLISQLCDRTVKNDVAMTGEISLRGLVLPVGGIKEKTLAALRAGIKTIMLPARNRKDLEEIPESARQKLQFVWLKSVDDALFAAFESSQSDRKNTDAAA